MHVPHFDSHTLPSSSDLQSLDRATAMPVGALLVRTAECLKALVQAPTAQAGLNESRYNVLDTLRRKASGACTQTELATNLLQSESNLSTLLDRMKRDGLITRVRSESDRRMTLIGLSSTGGEALIRADQARARAAAPVLQILDDRCEAALHNSLEVLLHGLEHALGVAGRAASGVDGPQP